MLGGGGASSAWRISAPELQHSRPLRSGSVDMDPFKATRNVWGAEEAFLSPPEYGGPLAACLESEESSEDCEEYVCGLAEEIAHSMLQEQEDEETSVRKRGIAAPTSVWSSHKMGSSPSSPQSTLSGVGSCHWELRGGSNKGSGSSGMSSPLTPQEADSIEALHEELLRVKLEDQVQLVSQHHMLSLQQQIIQRPLPTASKFHQRLSSPSCNGPRSLHPPGSRGRCPEIHVPKDNVLALAIDRAMMVKQGRQQARSKGSSPEVVKQVGGGWGGAAAAGGGAGGSYQQGCGRRAAGGGSNTSDNSPGGGGKKRREEQQQFSLFTAAGSNVGGGGAGAGAGAGGPMRAVFLGAPASRECGGTGVFLPRRLGSTHHQDSKRKPACSTVLLPSHIVQALNLNVEDTLPSSHHRRDLPSSYRSRHHSSQVRIHRLEPKEEISSGYFPISHSTTLQEVAPNISLPSEWTY